MVKTIEKERRSYMTYAMKMQEERKIGIKEGMDTKTTEFVVNMLKKHYKCDDIVKLAGTTRENVIRIADLHNLAYN